MRPRLVPAPKIDSQSDDEILRRTKEFYEMMQRRRTFRDFSDRPVPRRVIEHCIRAAGTAPSGANLQPWHFEAVSDPVVKQQIRIAERHFRLSRHAKGSATETSSWTRRRRWLQRPVSDTSGFMRYRVLESKRDHYKIEYQENSGGTLTTAAVIEFSIEKRNIQRDGKSVTIRVLRVSSYEPK